MVVAGERHMVVLTSGGELLTFGVDPGGRKTAPATMPTGPVLGARHLDQRWQQSHRRSHKHRRGAGLGRELLRAARHPRHCQPGQPPVQVRIPKLRGGHIVGIVAGGDSVLARSSQHQVYAWGQGRFGQNGNDAGPPTRPDRPR